MHSATKPFAAEELAKLVVRRRRGVTVVLLLAELIRARLGIPSLTVRRLLSINLFAVTKFDEGHMVEAEVSSSAVSFKRRVVEPNRADWSLKDMAIVTHEHGLGLWPDQEGCQEVRFREKSKCPDGPQMSCVAGPLSVEASRTAP